MDKPKHLYHYTDVNGLVGILREGRLRATHYRFMNDKEEVLLGLGLVEELRKTRPELPGLYSLGYQWEITTGFFMVCFSRQRDSVPLWLSYGDYAIAFRVDWLESLDSVDVHPISYGSSGGATKLLSALETEPITRSGLTGLLAGMKNEVWSFEDEWRGVVVNQEMGQHEIHFVASNTGPKPYVELPLTPGRVGQELSGRPDGERRETGCSWWSSEDTRRCPIAEIIVGPHAYQSERHESLQVMVESYRLPVRVTSSLLPLRR